MIVTVLAVLCEGFPFSLSSLLNGGKSLKANKKEKIRKSLKSRELPPTASSPRLMDDSYGFPFEEALELTATNAGFRLPPCPSPVIFTGDVADVQKTIYNCSQFAAAPFQIPSSL